VTRLLLIGKANTLSYQLSEIQKLGLVPSGKPIRWDSRRSDYPDYLALEVKK
jgi:hypothetical protein